MTAYIRTLSLAVLLIGAMLAPESVGAQKPHHVTRTPDELLAAFAREYQTSSGPTHGAAFDVAHVLTYPRDYPAADLKIFLRGLEQLALTGDSSRLRVSATFNLSLPGSLRKPHPVMGTMARLERIYERSNDPAVRGMVVVAMSDLAERQKALVFLERIARQGPEGADFPAAPSRALGSLVAMGDEGRAVLKRLHETAAVRDPEAKLELATLSKQDFRVP